MKVNNKNFIISLDIIFFLVEDEDVGSFLKPRTHSFQETSDKNLFHLLDKISEIDLFSFNEETKLKLILDLRAITLKNWTHKFYSEVKKIN